MNKYFNKPTIYVSHAILGTNKDMEGNCAKAIKAIKKLRRLFPEVNFYLPADSDLVLQILYKAKKLSVKNILWADLEILRNCNQWFYYRFDESKGSETERTEAIKCGFVEGEEHDIRYNIGKANYTLIRQTFEPIVYKAIKNFRRINENNKT